MKIDFQYGMNPVSPPAKVFDADGVEINDHILSCDLKTGECVCLTKDSKGQFLKSNSLCPYRKVETTSNKNSTFRTFQHSLFELKRTTIQHKAPLTVVDSDDYRWTLDTIHFGSMGDIPTPCRLFDADGQEITDDVNRVDLATGQAWVFLRNEEGHLYEDPECEGAMAGELRQYKAPMVLVDANGKTYVTYEAQMYHSVSVGDLVEVKPGEFGVKIKNDWGMIEKTQQSDEPIITD